MRTPADETFVPPPGRASALPLTVAVAGLLVLTGLGQGTTDPDEPTNAVAVLTAEPGAAAAARPAARAAAAEERRHRPRIEDAERDRLLRLIILFGGGAPPYGFFK